MVAVRSQVAIGTNAKAAGRDIHEITHISSSSGLFVAPGKVWTLPVRPKSQHDLIEAAFISNTATLKKEVFAPAALTIEDECYFDQSVLSIGECIIGNACTFAQNLYLAKGAQIGKATQIRGWLVNQSSDKISLGRDSKLEGIYSKGPVVLEDACQCNFVLSEADVWLGKECLISRKLSGFNVYIGPDTKANQVIANHNLSLENGATIALCDIKGCLGLSGAVFVTGQNSIMAGNLSYGAGSHLTLGGADIRGNNIFHLMSDGRLRPYDASSGEGQKTVISSLLTHQLLNRLGDHAPRF